MIYENSSFSKEFTVKEIQGKRAILKKNKNNLVGKMKANLKSTDLILGANSYITDKLNERLNNCSNVT